MAHAALKLLEHPNLTDGRLVVSFTGWMDGGEVSTGTVRWLAQHLGAKRIAEIDPEDFYLTNFPGSMEVAALFRPQVTIKGGLIESLESPTNEFLCAPQHNLVLFAGKEPNMHWRRYAECIFQLAKQVGVTRVYFVGTFAGAMPHTRQPRLYASVSEARLKPALAEMGLRFSDYEGPASFSTHLMVHATAHHLDMISLVAEITGYIEGPNPLSIEAVTRKLAAILALPVDLSEMRAASDEWENRVTAAAAKDPKLAKRIRKLEERYDDELIEGSPSAPPSSPET
jgi:proteasome assembly chaperone (PAC2) family protein